MASIGTYNLETRRKGDSFREVLFSDFAINDVPVDLTDATVRVKFRRGSKLGKEVRAMTELDGLTVTSTSVKINEFKPITFDAGIYYYDVEITLASGRIKTFVEGTFTVEQDTTY